MAYKEIPARKEITCDKCFQIIPLNSNRYQYIIKSNYGNPYNMSEESKQYQWDFCSDCNKEMYRKIVDELIPF